MVNTNQSSIDLLRSLRSQIAVSGIGSFKVFRSNDKHTNESARRAQGNKNKDSCRDSQLVSICPDN